MPKSREPLPSPLDAVRKVLETGTIGGGRTREPEPEAPTLATGQQGTMLPGQPDAMLPGHQGTMSTGQQDNMATWQPDARVPGQPDNMLPGRQGARATGQARVSRAGWEPQSIYLPRDLRRRLKIYSVTTGQEMGEIIAELLQQFFDRTEQK